MPFEHKSLVLAAIKACNAALGFGLSIGLALTFGTTRETDALFMAMFIPVVLARELAGVIRNALIPCLIEESGEAGRAEFAASFQAWMLLLAVALSIGVYGAAPGLIRLVAPGFDAMARQQTVLLVRWLSPCLGLLLLCGSAQGFFHARRQFAWPEIGDTVNRSLALLALFFLGRSYGVVAYAAGLTVAALAQCGLLYGLGGMHKLGLFPPLRRPRLTQRMLLFFGGAGIVLCSLAMSQLEEGLDRIFLSRMAPGALAAFSYAGRIAQFAPALLAASFLMPLVPEISELRARTGDTKRLARYMAFLLEFMGVPLCLVIYWAAADLVEVLLLHGELGRDSAVVIQVAIQAFALGIPAIFLVLALKGLFLIERNLPEIFRVGLLAIGIRWLGNILLSPLGAYGIALSGTITLWGAALYLWFRVRPKTTLPLPWTRLLSGCLGLLLILHVPPWADWIPWAWLRAPLGGCAGLAFYAAAVWTPFRRLRSQLDATIRPEGRQPCLLAEEIDAGIDRGS